MVTIEKELLKILVDNFYSVCSLCDELNIYEWEDGDESMQKMEVFVDENFGRNLENLK